MIHIKLPNHQWVSLHNAENEDLDRREGDKALRQGALHVRIERDGRVIYNRSEPRRPYTKPCVTVDEQVESALGVRIVEEDVDG